MLAGLRKLFRRQKPRVYLGTLAVVPRSDLKRHLEFPGFHSAYGLLDRDDVDTDLREALRDLFALPPAAGRDPKLDSDLALDVFIPKYQRGAFLPLAVGSAIIPLCWRPKVTITARLYCIETGKTRASYVVNEKARWSEYIRRIPRLAALFLVNDVEAVFTSQEIQRLFYQGAIRLLQKVQRDI